MLSTHLPLVLVLVLAPFMAALVPPARAQVTIDNDLGGEIGGLSAHLRAGGEIDWEQDFTGVTFVGREPEVAELVVFQYLPLVDVGGGGQRLSATTVTTSVTLIGDDTVASSGWFTGSAENTIDWTVTSSIPDGGSLLTNEISFTARTGTLGPLRFYQYLDADVAEEFNDVLLIRGSAAGGDLGLFVYDNPAPFGVSQSGWLNSGQGLAGAMFAGWAADRFDDILPQITAGTLAVSLAGNIDEADLPPLQHPQLGPVYGPEDVTLAVAWDMHPSATSATIGTSLQFHPMSIPPATLDVDDDGTVQALTDGLLIMRHLAGFSGEVLVADVLASNAGRTDPAEIAAYLDGMGDTLDVDQDARTLPLTDGLLILRHLASFSGDVLVQDALAPDAVRTDPLQVAAYIQSLMPPAVGNAAPLPGSTAPVPEPSTLLIAAFAGLCLLQRMPRGRR